MAVYALEQSQLQGKADIGGVLMMSAKTTYIKVREGNGCISWAEKGKGDDGEILLVNRAGGYRPLDEEDVILDEVTAENMTELDWKGTYLHDHKAKAGWLAPDGRYIGCGYRNHISCANLVLKATEDQLERRGFVKINQGAGEGREGYLKAPDYYFFGVTYGRRLTVYQQEWLKQRGYEIDELYIGAFD